MGFLELHTKTGGNAENALAQNMNLRVDIIQETSNTQHMKKTMMMPQEKDVLAVVVFYQTMLMLTIHFKNDFLKF